MDDIATAAWELVRFPKDPIYGYGIHMPSTHDLRALWGSHKLPPSSAPEDSSSDFVKELQRRAVIFRNQLNKAPRPAAASSVPGTPGPRTTSGEEARIRSMKGSEALAECAVLRIAVEPHTTNAGITAMRAKNALLLHVKRNPPPIVRIQARPAPATRPAPGAKRKVQWNVS